MLKDAFIGISLNRCERPIKNVSVSLTRKKVDRLKFVFLPVNNFNRVVALPYKREKEERKNDKLNKITGESIFVISYTCMVIITNT